MMLASTITGAGSRSCWSPFFRRRLLPVHTVGSAAVVVVGRRCPAFQRIIGGTTDPYLEKEEGHHHRLKASLLRELSTTTRATAFASSHRLAAATMNSKDCRASKQGRGMFVGGAVRTVRGGGGGSFRNKTELTTTITTGDKKHNNVDDDDDDDDDVNEPEQRSSQRNNNNNDNSTLHRVYIAVGSNVGDRYDNIRQALSLLTETNRPYSFSSPPTTTTEEVIITLRHTSYLHETAPMYVTDQPSFLNGVIEIETNLSPLDLLRKLKDVERMVGRDLNDGIRYGPRSIDLDILLYEKVARSGVWVEDEDDNDDGEQLLGGEGSGAGGVMKGGCGSVVLDTPELVVPHPRMSEREFVLSPLCDLNRHIVHPVLNATVGELFDRLLLHSQQQKKQEQGNKFEDTQSKKDENHPPPTPSAVRVLPLPRNRFLHLNETIIMGILNVTPDSFSDGGLTQSTNFVNLAVQRAVQMKKDGAGIIDVGGESTRPGAEEVTVDEELRRTIPVIERIRQVSDIPISIDTRHSTVAKMAIKAGADIVNDVSGGTHDPTMLHTVSQLGVPMVLMHMRGTPQTMRHFTTYDDVVTDVCTALLNRSDDAESAGIQRWNQILDPGIGFAKDARGNMLLLRHSGQVRSLVRDFPLLWGPSRKRFLGHLITAGEETNDDPEGRDFATAAACIVAVNGMGAGGNGCCIVRVHNVKGVRDAIRVWDGINLVE